MAGPEGRLWLERVQSLGRSWGYTGALGLTGRFSRNGTWMFCVEHSRLLKGESSCCLGPCLFYAPYSAGEALLCKQGWE